MEMLGFGPKKGAVLMAIPPRAGQDRLDILFPPTVDDPPAQSFELGLVLGGTVSVGTYTAGAIDFLFQALEAWHANAPPHTVMVKAAAGTSGGAVCAAMLGILSSRQVPHISGDQQKLNSDPTPTTNPLWDVWVNDFEISKLLDTTDIVSTEDADAGTGVRPGPQPDGDGTPAQHVPSILNSAMIEKAGADLVALAQSGGAIKRDYFASPFRVAVTVSNLRGIPFAIKAIPTYGQFSGAAFLERDDFAWFAFPNGAAPDDCKREDEFWLSSAPGPGSAGYRTLADFATASGSLPLGLPGRLLARPAEHYLYRPSVRATLAAPGYTVDWTDPDWSELPDVVNSGTYTYTAVDGGCFNNDPVTLVHRALAGLIGRNPQSKSQATRAMLMIDPLADEPAAIPPTGRSVVRVLGELVGMFTNGTRYLTADMDLFRRDDVFSRFQMVPTRPEAGRVGAKALAGSKLQALAGWCAREYRVHDFLLGRANMQAYLASELVLAGDNPLFDKWSPTQRAQFAVDGAGVKIGATAIDPAKPGAYFLPVLPDVTGADAKLPDWPLADVNTTGLQYRISSRLDAVLGQLRADNFTGLLAELAALLAVPAVSNLLASTVVATLCTELREAGLMAPAAVVVAGDQDQPRDGTA